MRNALTTTDAYFPETGDRLAGEESSAKPMSSRCREVERSAGDSEKSALSTSSSDSEKFPLLLRRPRHRFRRRVCSNVGSHPNISVAHINFRECLPSPLASGNTDRSPSFNVCPDGWTSCRRSSGADFRTSMIGKTVEVHGFPSEKSATASERASNYLGGRSVRLRPRYSPPTRASGFRPRSWRRPRRGYLPSTNSREIL